MTIPNIICDDLTVKHVTVTSLASHLQNSPNYRKYKGPSWSWLHGSWIFNYLCNQCLSPLMLWVRISIRVRCTILCDTVCQWLATGRWFSPGTPASSTTKTGRRDIIEILLKLALTTINQTKPSNEFSIGPPFGMLINSWSIPNEIRNLICKTKIVPNIWKRQ